LIKDEITAGFLAGSLGSIVKSILNMIVHNVKLVSYSYADLAASLFVKADAVHGLPIHTLGVITDIFLGASLGIILLYIIKRTGRNNLWLKGVVFGSAIWLIARLLLNMGVTNLIPQGAGFGYMSLLEHWIFGLVTLYSINAIYRFDLEKAN
jgi:hypothetical protein